MCTYLRISLNIRHINTRLTLQFLFLICYSQKMLLSILALLVLFSGGESAEKDIYDGYKVFRLQPTTDEQNFLLDDMSREDSALDFWSEINKAGIPVDVMVPPELQDGFENLMKESGIGVKVFINNVKEKISQEKVSNNSRSGMTWNSYYKLQDIYSWMDSLPRTHPGRASVFKAGSTFEKRAIKGIKISHGEGRRAVFIEGGIHAREWISPATVTYIINELLNSQDPNVMTLAKTFDWYIVPVFNPDGYVFTHNYDRLWRKTRSGSFYSCKGTDANRNWDMHWGEEGTSKNQCAGTYGGPKPFSEVETLSTSKFISSLGNNLDVYLAFHSYSQLMLMPYGHTEDHLDNYDDVLAIGQKAAEALERRYGTKYKVGNIAETIYKASGGSMDWAKDQYRVPIAFTYELRDTGKHGFLLPAEQIVPNCEEVMDSIVAMFKEGQNLGYFSLMDY